MPLVVLAALLAALAWGMVAPGQAHAARAYGSLCSTYESDNDPACIDSGSAYGAYQMRYDKARSFAVWLQNSSVKTYANWGKRLEAAESVKVFDKVWTAIAKENPEKFFTYQYSYCKRYYYEPAVEYWKKAAPGFSPSNYTWALRSVLFSTAIQHGPYGSCERVFKLALDDLGGWKKSLTEKQLINAIYYERSEVTTKKPKSGAIRIASTEKSRELGIANKYMMHFYSCSSAVQIGVYDRLHNNERKAALNMLAKLSAGEQPAAGQNEAVTTYKITYYLNGGTQASGQKKSFTATTSTFKLKVPTRAGYAFGGWYTSKDFKTKITYVKKGTKKNLRLYAKWSALTSPFRVKVLPSTGLNVRSTYASTGAIRGHLVKGTAVTVNKVRNDWGRLADGRGWICLKYTKQL